MKNLNMEIIRPEAFRSIISHLPNPSEMMMDKKDFYATIEEMILDAKIGSHLRLRKDIVANLNYVITQGSASDRVYEFVRDNFATRLNWENDVKEFLTAIEYGHSFSEVIWVKNSEGYMVPDSLRNKHPAMIAYKVGTEKKEGAVRSCWVPVLAVDGKELNMPYKFLNYRNNPRAENPYGTSDLLMCWWPWKFKQLGWEFWLRAAEKAGVPSLVALFETQDEEERAQKLANSISSTLVGMQGGDAAALANVRELKTLEMSGALQDHKVLIETCNQEISFALTTQSLSTQEGNYGTRAQASVHDENLLRVAQGDAKALQGVFQQLIEWMVELNFGKDIAVPKFEFDLKVYASFAELMQAIEKGVPVSREALYTRYKLPRPKDEADSFVAMGGGELSLSDEGKKKVLKNRTFQ